LFAFVVVIASRVAKFACISFVVLLLMYLVCCVCILQDPNTHLDVGTWRSVGEKKVMKRFLLIFAGCVGGICCFSFAAPCDSSSNNNNNTTTATQRHNNNQQQHNNSSTGTSAQCTATHVVVVLFCYCNFVGRNCD